MPIPLTVSVYQQHKNNWSDCTACPLHLTRSNVVLARGKIPCDVLLIGEAPGKAEDVLGSPFVGIAGQLLDRIIADSIEQFGEYVDMGDGSVDWKPMFRYALTNLVACIPVDEDGVKQGEPSKESIESCASRLIEFINICKPRLIVTVGTLARDWLDQKARNHIELPSGIKQVFILHPAFILRQNMTQRGLLVQRCSVDISTALDELYAKG